MHNISFLQYIGLLATQLLVKRHTNQYFSACLVTLLSLVTLIPFFTFSTFHALGYVRTNIIPNIFPAATSNNGTTVTWQAKTQQKIKAWTDKYYSVAMRFVAHSEVTVIAVRLLLGVFR